MSTYIAYCKSCRRLTVHEKLEHQHIGAGENEHFEQMRVCTQCDLTQTSTVYPNLLAGIFGLRRNH